MCRDEHDKDCVRVAEGGRVLDRIPIDRRAFALMLGAGWPSDDGR